MSVVLNVLLYGDTDNPLGYPTDWPAEVIEVEDGSAEPESPWLRMTVQTYDAYITEPTRLAIRNAWRNLELLRQERIDQIDLRTEAIILEGDGFLYDGRYFSMSEHAQANWSDLAIATTNVLQGSLTSSAVFPMTIATKDELGYTIPDAQAAMVFIYQAYIPTREAIKAAGRMLKAQVAAAVTVDEVDAIVDSR